MLHICPGMRRHTGLAVAGAFAVLLVGGCSGSGTSDPTSSCASSGGTGLGFGPGPVYLTGQSSWYSGGQAALLRVDAKYSGPLQVQASQSGGDGTSQITLAPMNLDP